ncbi:hypothetical protein RJ640_012770 [Escallonia rubra]|uniref:Integrase catalytic domain-containing protein n=1 Tax=Escallonia rubra TaxID=112253 RepID=A0AA88S8B5_9ASTE|nr:hypothetical protein RJ640_012770 [Escallonia rubra]
MTNPDFETSRTKSSPIVIQSEGSSFKAGIILNDTNYDLWSQIMEMHIAEKEKLSFIRDRPDKVIMESENDVESYRKSVQRQMVHIFLAGLDGEFEQVRAEILRKDPIPELEACHAMIRRESVRRTKMVEESERTEASAMVTRYRPSQNQPKPTNAADKSTYKCTHCNQNGHTKNRCYELVGYPEWWDHNRDPRKRNSKRTSSTAVVETKTEDDVTGQHSALAAAAGNGGKALNMSTLVTNSAWIIDSGATDHMTFDSRQVSTLKQSSQKFVTTANGTPAPIVGEGHLPLTSNMNLNSVLVVPSLDYNLLSVSQITTALFCVVIFWPIFCVFKDIRTRQTIGCGVRRGKLYYLDLVSKSSDKLRQALMVNDSEGEMRKSEIWLWHRRLGHASFGYLKKLFPSLFTKCDVSSFQCEVCELAKSHRVSFPLALNKSPDPFMIIHSDVWGPSKVNSLGGSRWFVTFIDDCTRMTWVQLMKSKSEVNVLFQQFCKMIHTQYNARIQVLRSDNGGEYLSAELQQYLKAHGIIHQTTCSNTPQQNVVAERKNRHLLEVVRASLIEAHLPLSYWGEALISAAYLINRVPSRTIDYQTPSQALVEAIVAPVLSNLPPHGEHQKEIQTLDYHDELAENVDVHISEDTQISEDAGNLDICEDELAEPVNQVGKFVEESSQEHAETEVVTSSQSEFDIPHATNTPHQSLVEDAPEPHRKQLPQRLTRACQPVDTPVEEGLKLRIESNQVPVDKGRYQRLVGRLMYLAHTRPDLAYALSFVIQYMHNPGEQHMNAVLYILRYPKSAPGQGILFTKNEDHQSVDVYTDADWAGAVDDRRSTSGYFTFVGGNLVTWRSKNQNVVAKSSAEAEFRGIALGVCEALWLRLLLQDLGCVSKQPIKLYCYNKAACDIAHNPVQHDRTKHVEIDRFFIKEKLDEKIVELPHIRSEDQLADILTKAVSSRVFSKFLSKLGMWDIYAPT